jgi:hypothetical protein
MVKKSYIFVLAVASAATGAEGHLEHHHGYLVVFGIRLSLACAATDASAEFQNRIILYNNTISPS